MIALDISGFPELDRKLAMLERGVSDEDRAEALMAGARVLGDEERRLAPKRSGNLARSIVEDMYPANLPGDGYTVYVGPRTGPGAPNGWYGYLVEVGREGVSAQPFARPAVDLKGQEAMGVVIARLAVSVERMAA